MPVPPAETIWTSSPAARQALAVSTRRSAGAPDLSLARDRVLDLHRVPFPGHQSGKAQVRQRVDEFGQFDRRLARQRSAALHADVDLDQDPRFRPGVAGRAIELEHVVRVIDRDDHIGLAREPGQSPGLDMAHDLVGDQDVPDSGRGHHLGLADLGAGHADRAGRDLLVDDGRGLVGLAVRPPLGTARGDIGRHGGDVVIQGIQVDNQCRRIDIAEGTAHERGVHLPDASGFTQTKKPRSAPEAPSSYPVPNQIA